MQFHGGVYRSDDSGEAWIDIITTKEAPERVYLDSNFKLRSSKYDDFEMHTTVRRTPFALTLDREGNIILDHEGIVKYRSVGLSWSRAASLDEAIRKQIKLITKSAEGQ